MSEDDENEQTPDLWDVVVAQVKAATAATMLIIEQFDRIKKLERLARQQDAMISTLFGFAPSSYPENEIKRLHQQFKDVQEPS